MLVDLNQKDLINLVRGVQPDYSHFDYLKQWGSFDGSRGVWNWSTSALESASESVLHTIYVRIK